MCTVHSVCVQERVSEFYVTKILTFNWSMNVVMRNGVGDVIKGPVGQLCNIIKVYMLWAG